MNEEERRTGKWFRKSFVRSIRIEDARSESSLLVHHARISEFSDQRIFSLFTNPHQNPSKMDKRRKGLTWIAAKEAT